MWDAFGTHALHLGERWTPQSFHSLLLRRALAQGRSAEFYMLIWLSNLKSKGKWDGYNLRKRASWKTDKTLVKA